MKGLLLKDLYVAKKHCRAYLLIVILFLALAFVDSENIIFIFYPCLMGSMIPVTLLSYDERSRWNRYSAVLPYTKAQLVSGKYLIGLLFQVVALLATGLTQGIRMQINGGFVLGEFAALMAFLLIVCCLASALFMPAFFKFGVEKGRIIYSVVIGLFCAVGFIVQTISSERMGRTIPFGASIPLFCLAAILLYAISWYLSIVFYRKREV